MNDERLFIKLYADAHFFGEENDTIQIEIEKELDELAERIGKKYNVRMEIN